MVSVTINEVGVRQMSTPRRSVRWVVYWQVAVVSVGQRRLAGDFWHSVPVVHHDRRSSCRGDLSEFDRLGPLFVGARTQTRRQLDIVASIPRESR